MTRWEREELAREEFEADNPRCRDHRIRGCRDCEERYDDEGNVIEPTFGFETFVPTWTVTCATCLREAVGGHAIGIFRANHRTEYGHDVEETA